MKAVVIREHGDVEVLRHEEVADPQIKKEDDVVIRVRACALNRLDIFVRQGLQGPGIRPFKLPHVSGVDVAGVVEAVGNPIPGLEPGRRVVVYPGLFCRECSFCRIGEESMCDRYRILGEDVWGGLAELTKAPACNVFPFPDSVAFEEAAAAGAASTTGWRMVVSTGGLQPQERILVLGAGGGVGSAALAFARRIGAFVIAVTSQAGKQAELSRLGADQVILLGADTDLVESVLDSTAGRGVDLVVNPVGGFTWRPALQCLRSGGRMTICGAGAGDNPDFSIREVYQKHRRILGSPMGSVRDFLAVHDLLARGEYSPAIDSLIPLKQIQEAHRRLESGEAIGKVVMRIGPAGT